MVLSLYEQYKKRQESKAEEKLKSLNEANEVYANYIKRFKDSSKAENEIKKMLVEYGMCRVVISGCDISQYIVGSGSALEKAFGNLAEKWKTEDVHVAFDGKDNFRFMLLDENGRREFVVEPEGYLNFWQLI